jgi:NAD(P)-dependent dehydrogenase (short-subunit alcohol dehydrogenase family)
VNCPLLAGRRVLVTGGASGIGAAVVTRMNSAGATGVVIDLPAALATSTGPWPGITADVVDEQQLSEAVALACNRLDGLDGVVAAAGIVPKWRRTVEMDLSEWHRILAVNAVGVAATIKCALRYISAGSTITVIGSMTSWRGDPNLAAYSASKHAVLGLVRSAARDIGPDGIRINAVAPGPVATDALLSRMAGRETATGVSVERALAEAAQETALGRIATVEQVADTVVFLTSTMSAGITGQIIPVDGGVL